MWRCQQTEFIGVTCSTEKFTGKWQERMCVLVLSQSCVPSVSPKAAQRTVQGTGHLRAFLPSQDYLLWPRLGSLFWKLIKTSEGHAVISLIIQGDFSSIPDPAALMQLNVGSYFLSHGHGKAGPRLLWVLYGRPLWTWHLEVQSRQMIGARRQQHRHKLLPTVVSGRLDLNSQHQTTVHVL